MSIVVHIVNTPKSDVREAYDAGWRLLDGQGVHHPSGRLSHTAWLVDDVLHVVDVWASSDDRVISCRSSVRSLTRRTWFLPSRLRWVSCSTSFVLTE